MIYATTPLPTPLYLLIYKKTKLFTFTSPRLMLLCKCDESHHYTDSKSLANLILFTPEVEAAQDLLNISIQYSTSNTGQDLFALIIRGWFAKGSMILWELLIAIGPRTNILPSFTSIIFRLSKKFLINPKSNFFFVFSFFKLLC